MPPDFTKAKTPYEIGAATGQGTLSTTPQGGVSYQSTVDTASGIPVGLRGTVTPYAPGTQPITAAALEPQTPLDPGIKPTPVNPLPGGITVPTITTPTEDKEQAPTVGTDWMKSLLDSIEPPPSVTSGYEADYAKSGIAGLEADKAAKRASQKRAQDELNAIQAQLQGVALEAQAIPIQIQQQAEGQGLTAGGVAPLQTAALRNNALRAIPLQAQAYVAQAKVAAAQGDTQLAQEALDSAVSHLDKIYQMHQTDAQNMYQYKKDLRDKVYDYASKQEQRQLDALQKADDRKYAEKRDLIERQRGLSDSAIKFGQSNLAMKISQLDPESPTFQQDLAKLEGQFKDPEQELKMDLLREQIATQRQNRTNSQVDRLIELAKLGDTGAQSELGLTPTDPSAKVTLAQKEAATLNQQITQNDNYKAIDKSISSWRALSEYEKLVNDVGATNRIVDPIDTGKARAVWNTALLNLKEYYNLGVLNGPDLEIMQQLVPSNVKGVLGTVAGGFISDYITEKRVKDAIANQKIQFEDKLDTDYLSVRNQYKDYSPEQLTNLQDLDRKYLQMKATINPEIALFLKENPDMPIEEKLQVINTRL